MEKNQLEISKMKAQIMERKYSKGRLKNSMYTLQCELGRWGIKLRGPED
jgi:hypothetical protein